ncbi:MAG: hypothetical protein Q7K21_01570 [Elusimicrobiota bacterium]|nr:hypothetical protein [Elusimicrobiota bacterium]
MKRKSAADGEKVFVFKVSPIGDSSVFRELALLETQTLYSFAEAIIDSFDFDLDHCFGFFNNVKNWYRAERQYELFKDVGEECKPDTKGVKKTKLREAFFEDKKLLFLFDYGDEWKFIVELVREEKSSCASNKKYPLLLQKIGSLPEQYPDFEEEDEGNSRVN